MVLAVVISSGASAQTEYSWAIPVSGDWSVPANWNPAGSPGGDPFDTATLGLNGPYTATANTSRALRSIYIENPLAILHIRSGTFLQIHESVLSVGEIVIGSQNNTNIPTLQLLDTASVGGLITLNSPSMYSNRARISGPAVAGQSGFLLPGTTIQGNGDVRGRFSPDFEGTIIANAPGGILLIDTAEPFRFTGTAKSINGGALHFKNGIIGGTVYCDSNSLVSAGYPGISEATLTGSISVGSYSTAVVLGPNNTYNGQISVNNGMEMFPRSIVLVNNATIGGVVHLDAPLGNHSLARLSVNMDHTASILPDTVIRGSGQITGRFTDFNGTIRGDTPGGVLEINTAQPLDSSGRLEAIKGGRLLLSKGMVGGTIFADTESRVSTPISESISNTRLTGVIVVSSMTNVSNTYALTLGANNTYDGEIVLNTGLNFTHLLTVYGQATLGGTVTLNAPANSTDRARIVGPTQPGQQATFLPGTIIRGTGAITGQFSPFPGTLAPSHPTQGGRLGINQLVMMPEAVAEFTLAGTDPSLHDRITGSQQGFFKPDGLVRVTLADDYTPAFGDFWNIIDGHSITGEFDTFELPAAPSGLAYRLIYEPHRVAVRLTCAADFAAPWGQLDFFDLSAYLNAFNAQQRSADLALPFGFFNFFDVAAYLNHFNAGCP